MKIRILFIMAILIIIGGSTKLYEANSYVGQVVFYNDTGKSVNLSDRPDKNETDDDFSYYINEISTILDNHNIKHEVMDHADFTIKTINGKTRHFDKKQFKETAGYILIKPNGEYIIRNGIGTGVDMMLDIYGYFGINP